MTGSDGSDRYDVRQVEVEARPVVVSVAQGVLGSADLGELILRLSGEAYGALDEAAVDRRHLGCNVALYRPSGDAGSAGSVGDPVTIEVGVELRDVPEDGPAALFGLREGPVRFSSLPAGTVATTLHRGPYQDLPAAHAAIRAWCAAHGLAPAGPNWEVYGDWNDDPGRLETEVFVLLATSRR